MVVDDMIYNAMFVAECEVKAPVKPWDFANIRYDDIETVCVEGDLVIRHGRFACAWVVVD